MHLKNMSSMNKLESNVDEIVPLYPKCPGIVFPVKTDIALNKRRKLLPEEQQTILHELQVIGRLSGFVYLLDSNSCSVNGRFIPAKERKRQLSEASEKKQKLLLERFGIQDKQNSKVELKKKAQSRKCNLALSFNIPKRRDNPRSDELARQMAVIFKKQDVDTDPVDDKKAIKRQLKERKELKKQKESMKKAKKRKEILQQVLKKKREDKASVILSALPKTVMPEVTDTEDLAPPTASPHATDTPASSFVFSLDEEPQQPLRKKKRTMQELKQDLKTQIEKKKMLSALQKAGEGALAQQVVSSHSWKEATQKIQGDKLDQISSLSRELKRAEHKQKNRGKKLTEILQRQKQDKHRRTLKRQHNLRERRVARLSKTIKKCAKKGHYIPGFM